MKLKLNNGDIDSACNLVGQFLTSAKVDSKDAVRIRIAVEETLIKYRDKLGENEEFSLKLIKKFGKPRIELSFIGTRVDPFTVDSDGENIEIMRSVLSGMGFIPNWQYKNGENIIIFTPKKKKPSQFFVLLIAIVSAFIFGEICLMLPNNIGMFLSENIVLPLFNTFTGLLTAVSGPMIFLCVVWGICGIGDISTFGKIGKRMICRFMVISGIITVFSCLYLLPFFKVSVIGNTRFNFKELFEIILDIIPGNFFTPFTEGNPIQLIFIASIIGISILVLGSKVSTVTTFIEQANAITEHIMDFISNLIPFFVFGCIFNMVMSGHVANMKSAYKLLPLMLVGELILMLVYLAVVAIRKRANFINLIKKVLPTFLIGITTASSAAAFITNTDCCEHDLGIDKKIVYFGVPLGQVIFMPGCIIQFMTLGFCMSEIYGISITPGWILSAMIISVTLSIAAPPVPGGALICYTILFAQLNLPAEAITIAIFLNVILEFVTTGVNILCLQTELVELSGSLNMLDLKKLRKSKIKK